jgi:hypothetical protein
MNRAYFIILIPALLVLIGYVLVFRLVGIALPYPAVIVPVALLVAVMAWMAKRSLKKPGATTK